MDRAADYESVGRGFNSLWARGINTLGLQIEIDPKRF